jgi:hypothetical protein
VRVSLEVRVLVGVAVLVAVAVLVDVCVGVFVGSSRGTPMAPAPPNAANLAEPGSNPVLSHPTPCFPTIRWDRRSKSACDLNAERVTA